MPGKMQASGFRGSNKDTRKAGGVAIERRMELKEKTNGISLGLSAVRT